MVKAECVYGGLRRVERCGRSVSCVCVGGGGGEGARTAGPAGSPLCALDVILGGKAAPFFRRRRAPRTGGFMRWSRDAQEPFPRTPLPKSFCLKH